MTTFKAESIEESSTLFTSIAASPTERRIENALFPVGFKQIDTPNDDSCLFWAAALGLLLPCLKDNDAFSKMYDRLFGSGPLPLKPDEKKISPIISIEASSTKEGVRNILYTYDCQKDTTLQYQGNSLQTLVRIILRGRIVNALDDAFPDPEDRESIVTAARADKPNIVNWEIYKDEMQKPNTWGGGAEIKAISHLAEINVEVYSEGTAPISYYCSKSETKLLLAHVNAKNKKEGRKNHYHYGLPLLIYEQLILNIPPVKKEDKCEKHDEELQSNKKEQVEGNKEPGSIKNNAQPASVSFQWYCLSVLATISALTLIIGITTLFLIGPINSAVALILAGTIGGGYSTYSLFSLPHTSQQAEFPKAVVPLSDALGG